MPQSNEITLERGAGGMRPSSGRLPVMLPDNAADTS
jgi:hypothetical protein